LQKTDPLVYKVTFGAHTVNAGSGRADAEPTEEYQAVFPGFVVQSHKIASTRRRFL
jgi:hypothetical protein